MINSVFNKGLGIWLVLAFFLLLINYVVTQFLYAGLYQNAINDIASTSLTSYFLIFDFIILLQLPGNLSLAKWVLPFAIVFATLNNMYDITLFEDGYGFGYDFRAAGNYLNPNASAQFLLMGMVLTAHLVRPNFRFLYFLLASIGVLLTLSRGAVPILVVLIISFIFLKRIKWISVVYGVAFMALVGFSLWGSVRTSKPYARMIEYLKYNNGIESRLEQILNPSSTKVGIRQVVFEEHYRFYKKSPIIGNGLGSSKYFETHYSASGHSSHFMYLHMLNEYGIPGLLLFLGLPISLFFLKSRWQFDIDILLFGLIVLIAGVQSHNLLDSYAMLFSYAFISVYKENTLKEI
ncbi:MAG: O-antigen ligase family protein [Saprospiraceae bacterium]|nr:O-antigen ligase family protein [Saprospiraceae bacterium]